MSITYLPIVNFKAVSDVLKERNRQLEDEHFTLDHDDTYQQSELAVAAITYIDSAIHGPISYQHAVAHHSFPWQKEYWKPTTPRRDLVKAAALLLAEIERLDRIEEREQRPNLGPTQKS